MNVNTTTWRGGFSMVETVIVVAILAILAGLATPAFIQFLDMKSAQDEANAMEEVHKALEVFATTYGFLPFDDGEANTTNNAVCGTNAATIYTWADCLAMVSNLSPDQIKFDAWGNERAYTMFRDTSASASYIDATLNRHYAMVLSRGVDQSAEAQTGVGTQASGGFVEYRPATHNSWWNKYGNTASKITRYTSMDILGDDDMVRYSDADLKRQQYEMTLERINKIHDALKAYSAARYNLAISNNETNANKKTYYPRSRFLATGGAEADSSGNYGNQVSSDSSLNFSGGMVENRIGQDTARLTAMVNLMRLLGLPDSYCCNAMERMTNDPEQEMPLYYYANPRARTGTSSCATSRASVGDTSPLYLPAKVQVNSYPCP